MIPSFFLSFFYCTINVYLRLIEPQPKAFDDDDVVAMGHYLHPEIKTGQKILQAPNFCKMWHVLEVRRQATAE